MTWKRAEDIAPGDDIVFLGDVRRVAEVVPPAPHDPDFVIGRARALSARGPWGFTLEAGARVEVLG